MSTQHADQPLKHVAELVHEATDVDWKASLRSITYAILSPLASLRLTVVLLVLAVLVIWVVTLEQTRYDIWTVKQKHFPELLVYIPFQTFFPPAWFAEMQEVPGGFFMPSGTLLLVLMIVNLASAHLIRMRVQAKGMRLILGFMGMAAGIAITWGVIFYGQNPDGFQGSPPVSYQFMWTLIQIGMLGLIVLAVGAIVVMEKHRLVEKMMLGAFALATLAVLVFLFRTGQDAFIGDSAMRILWQLIQSTIAALILLAGCILVFNRKGGIVLIHLGIGLLMVNELYVTMTNVEQRMTVIEGQTVSHTIDLRSTELMVMTETEDDQHDMVLIPQSELLKNQIISRDDLPFDIECLDYYPNSELIRAMGDMKNKADSGYGTVYVSRELPRVAGVKEDEIDMASAYIRLIDKKSKKDIGIYMSSQLATLNEAYDEIEVGGKVYYMALRFQHYYKPYSITLNDVEREDYVGTDTAKSYSSKFVLNDHEKNIASNQRIWMNNPLRYGNETFYQSGHDFTEDGRELTVMQIVENSGWMIPYVACMIVVVGLFAQFGSTLLKFLEKAQKKAREKEDAPLHGAFEPDVSTVPSKSGRPDKRVNWVVLTLVGILAAYVGMKAMRAGRATVEKAEMKLDQFGQIPITYGGRVQSLDTLARNTLRQLANREEVVYPGAKSKMFGMSLQKEPAIRWLADTIYQVEGYDKVQVVRIEDLSVAGALGLPKSRKGLKYTLAELESARPELNRLVNEARKLEKEEWTPLQKRLMDVYNKLDMVFGITMSLSKIPDDADVQEPLASVDLARRLLAGSTPRNVYIEGEGWVPQPVAFQRKRISDLAKEKGFESLREVAKYLVQIGVVEPELDMAIKQVLIAIFIENREMVEEVMSENGLTDLRQVVQFLGRRIDANPQGYDDLPVVAKVEVDREMEKVLAEVPDLEDRVTGILKSINNNQDELIEVDQSSLDLLSNLEDAYIDEDAEKFNQAVAARLAEVEANPPSEYSASVMSVEKRYNSFSPFYMATLLYFVVILLTLIGWMGIPSVRRAAFWVVVLALVVQVVGIVMRVWISGRPPVTNLYSSFVVVCAASVAIMLIVEKVTKMGIGNMLAGIAGTALLVWAWTISIRDGDTFTVLVAVLDTQFWLSTHVMCISMGYAATVAAGLLGFAFLIASLVDSKFDKSTRTTFGKLIYGTVCFALLLSFFGTVLGGLWGDDSWGRFWGWDPKENGALMIVFWNAVVLHARWGGMIRERGLAGWAIFGNVVTLWSWEGVNQLGVGLHSYGVSEGRLQIIIMIALVHCLFALLAFIPMSAWASNRKNRIA